MRQEESLTSLKQRVKQRWPRSSKALGTAYRSTIGQAIAELRVIRQVGLKRIFQDLVARSDPSGWETALPVQRPRRYRVDFEFSDAGELTDHLRKVGVEWKEGTHTIYLPPSSLTRSPFASISVHYPRDAGLKLSKSPGGVEQSTYVYGDTWSTIQKRLTSDHRRLTLVANLLAVEELGPDLYDLIELECGPSVWTAYIVQHVEGRDPEPDECRAGLDRLRELEAEGTLTLAAPNGFDHIDFQPPTCNGNALIGGPSEHFQYIDFQNILLCDYGSRLTTIAVDAQEASHFGQRSLIRGGAYLYQRVPGLGLPAKRDTAVRSETIQGLLRDAGTTVENRLVLDVGCNIGMMMAEYLRLGAHWCIGWDLPKIAPHTARLLRSIGCTRFHAHPANLERSYPLMDDVDDFLTPMLDGCVISFLALHRHVGWLEAFGTIPWAHMIYEGHEDESPEMLREYLGDLRKLVDFEASEIAVYQDGDCRPRAITVLTRR